MYQNSNEAHIFYSALSFKEALMDIFTSNRSRVTAGFVKEMERKNYEQKPQIHIKRPDV